MSWAIAVHGGAGDWDESRHALALAGASAAVTTGIDRLRQNGSALEAAVAAVMALEDDPLFNAGTGCVLNRDGEAEMDASVATGHDLGFGAVGAIRRVRNPVLVAREVLMRSGHVLLVGEGALAFARAHGFADYDPVTSRALTEWQRARADARLGTVGAVALDNSGCMAAATSTGGTLLKHPGRIGDTPLPGAGTYATSYAAVSATGKGELMMRTLAARSICDLIEQGVLVQHAVERVLEGMRGSVGAEAGFIAIARDGSIGVTHGTAFMVHAWASSSDLEVSAAMKVQTPT